MRASLHVFIYVTQTLKEIQIRQTTGELDVFSCNLGEMVPNAVD